MVWYSLYFIGLENAIDFFFGLGPSSVCWRHIKDGPRPPTPFIHALFHTLRITTIFTTGRSHTVSHVFSRSVLSSLESSTSVNGEIICVFSELLLAARSGAMKFNVVMICPSSSSRDSFRGNYVTTSDYPVYSTFEPNRNWFGELITRLSRLYYISK